MDLLYLREMLGGLSSNENSIKITGEYCCHQSYKVSQVIDEIVKFIRQVRIKKRILYFHLLHEIMVRAKEKKIPSFITEINNRIKTIVNNFVKSVDDPNHLQQLMNIIEGWKAKDVFVIQQLDNIRKKIIEPAYHRLITETDIVQEKPQRYSKTFLSNYLVVNEQPWSAKIYQVSQKWQELDTKIGRFNLDLNILDISEPEFIKKRVEELLQIGYKYKQDLEELIVGHMQGHRMIELACLQVIDAKNPK